MRYNKITAHSKQRVSNVLLSPTWLMAAHGVGWGGVALLGDDGG